MGSGDVDDNANDCIGKMGRAKAAVVGCCEVETKGSFGVGIQETGGDTES